MRVLPKQNFFSIWLKTAQRLRFLTMSFWSTFSSRFVNEVQQSAAGWTLHSQRKKARPIEKHRRLTRGAGRQDAHRSVWGLGQRWRGEGLSPPDSADPPSTPELVSACFQECSSTALLRSSRLGLCGDVAYSKLEKIVFLQLTEHFWHELRREMPKGSGSASLVRMDYFTGMIRIHEVNSAFSLGRTRVSVHEL